jgi:hypothetical protein
VIQDEASRESSKSGLPMFGDKFGERGLNWPLPAVRLFAELNGFPAVAFLKSGSYATLRADSRQYGRHPFSESKP